jgi:hypothetical protein
MSQVSSKVLRCSKARRSSRTNCGFDIGSALQMAALLYSIFMIPADNMKDEELVVVRWHMSAFGLSSWGAD